MLRKRIHARRTHRRVVEQEVAKRVVCLREIDEKVIEVLHARRAVLKARVELVERLLPRRRRIRLERVAEKVLTRAEKPEQLGDETTMRRIAAGAVHGEQRRGILDPLRNHRAISDDLVESRERTLWRGELLDEAASAAAINE